MCVLLIFFILFFLLCFAKFQSNELNDKISHRNRYMKRLKPNTYITNNMCVDACIGVLFYSYKSKAGERNKANV